LIAKKIKYDLFDLLGSQDAGKPVQDGGHAWTIVKGTKKNLIRVFFLVYEWSSIYFHIKIVLVI